MMRLITFSLFWPILLAGCGPADDGSPGPDAVAGPKVADVGKDYKQFQAMTPKPVFVDPQLAMLCRGASQAEVELARKKNGPHAHTAVLIYMNDLAANAFRKSLDAFPVGSIVVKEKKGLRYWADGQARQMEAIPDGVGGMIKHPPGYNQENGDWEYFYFEDPAKIETGKIASCVKCHAGAAKKDYVFGGWAK